MAIATDRINGGGRQMITSATTTATDFYTSTHISGYYGYPVSYNVDAYGYIASLPNDTPAKKKTFEDKLQDEIDEWLSIFKEK